MFVEFGDYNVMRDTNDSCFIEFYAYDKTTGISDIGQFISALEKEAEKYGVAEVRSYENARKFKAFV